MSVCAICPVSEMGAANAALDAQGFGPRNFMVPAYASASPTHAVLHAWGGGAFAAALAALPAVTVLQADDDTSPAEMVRALCQPVGATWGRDAAPLPDVGTVQSGALYATGDVEDRALWWVIQPHDRAVFGGDPEQYPALIRRARIPGQVKPWRQPLDQFDAYRVTDPFTARPDEVERDGLFWRVESGDGAGLNVQQPGAQNSGWVQITGPGGEPVAAAV